MRLRRVAVVALMLAGCWTEEGSWPYETAAADGREGTETPVGFPDGGFPDSVDKQSPEWLSPDQQDVEADCEAGACFLSPCASNDDCLSGWCVEHMGAGVCSLPCQEECPAAGFACLPVAGSGRDLTYACVSKYANLCKPCSSNGDCKSPGATDDVCLSYGAAGAFCGGSCSEKGDCPDGFECTGALTVDGTSLFQCVAEAGECACTEKSASLGLGALCAVENDFGKCKGKRTCTPGGLTPCDAATPAPEVCNGVDDDCDGMVDEAASGRPVGLCDDGNSCTQDACQGAEGCTHEPQTGPECKDGDTCTVADTCQAGECTGVPMDCDDGNVCTGDSCDPQLGCVHAAVSDGTACATGNWLCAAGECACNPQCTGKDCGEDGCGGSCGVCSGQGNLCVDGKCQCTPQCTGKQCGEDGCGGVCGSCGCGEVCEASQCVLHACDGQECGLDPDGCGVACGSCQEGFTCDKGKCLPLCSPYLFGNAGAGVNNGLTCEDVCANMGGVNVAWTGLQEQIAYCQALHPGANVYVADPNKKGYPLWEPQANRCRVNKDGSMSSAYPGSGSAESGEQVLCRCQKKCECPILCYDSQVCLDGECVDVDCPDGYSPVAGGPNGKSFYMTPDCTGPEQVDSPPSTGPWRLSPTPLCRANGGLVFMALSTRSSPACLTTSVLPDSVWLQIVDPK